jgi:GNAT superfamily N-acetyltransferase
MVFASREVDDRPLGRSGLDEASRLAVRAFGEDPFFHFLMPEEQFRDRGLRIIHRTVLAHAGKFARIRTVRGSTGEIAGVALWLPTGRFPPSPAAQAAQLPGVLRAFARRPRTMARGAAYMKASAKAHPKDPHWYLLLLMTDPVHQRQGVGTLLLHDGLARVDEEGVASGLETQNEENLAYYRRFGYELRTTLTPVPGGPPLYSMWREPRAAP